MTDFTRYCNVAPIHIQMELVKRSHLGNRHLLLAHDVVANAQAYQELFGKRPWTGHVILDNSAYELRSSVDTKMVWEAIEICRPTCVVLPDTYMDKDKTLGAITDVYVDWCVRRDKYHADYKRHLAFMMLPQGANVNEWNSCAEVMARTWPNIDWWGIPRNFAEELLESRRSAMDLLMALNPIPQVHLFGFSHDYVDDLLTLKYRRADRRSVDSIDTTTPIRAGSLGVDFSLNMELPKRGDWWDNAAWNDKIIDNLTYCRKLFS